MQVQFGQKMGVVWAKNKSSFRLVLEWYGELLALEEVGVQGGI